MSIRVGLVRQVGPWKETKNDILNGKRQKDRYAAIDDDITFMTPIARAPGMATMGIQAPSKHATREIVSTTMQREPVFEPVAGRRKLLRLKPASRLNDTFSIVKSLLNNPHNERLNYDSEMLKETFVNRQASAYSDSVNPSDGISQRGAATAGTYANSGTGPEDESMIDNFTRLIGGNLVSEEPTISQALTVRTKDERVNITGRKKLLGAQTASPIGKQKRIEGKANEKLLATPYDLVNVTPDKNALVYKIPQHITNPNETNRQAVASVPAYHIQGVKSITAPSYTINSVVGNRRGDKGKEVIEDNAVETIYTDAGRITLESKEPLKSHPASEDTLSHRKKPTAGRKLTAKDITNKSVEIAAKGQKRQRGQIQYQKRKGNAPTLVKGPESDNSMNGR